MKLSYKSLRSRAIRQIKKREFALAVALFSLAYEQNQSEEILAFIDFCSLAIDNPDEAADIFGLYFSDEKEDQSENLREMIQILRGEFDELAQKTQSQNAILYGEFKALVAQNGDFKKVFQSVIYSTKIIISSKDDLVDFIGDLVENGYDELGMNYLENLGEFVEGDEKLLKIAGKIRRNENRA